MYFSFCLFGCLVVVVFLVSWLVYFSFETSLLEFNASEAFSGGLDFLNLVGMLLPMYFCNGCKTEPLQSLMKDTYIEPLIISHLPHSRNIYDDGK